MVTLVFVLLGFGMLLGLVYVLWLAFHYARLFLVFATVGPWLLLLIFAGRWLERRAKRSRFVAHIYRAYDLVIWLSLPFQVVFFSTLVVGLLVLMFFSKVPPESTEDFVFGMLKISIMVVLVIAGSLIGFGVPYSLYDRVGNQFLRRLLQLPLFLLGLTLFGGLTLGVPYLIDTRFATLADLERQGLTVADAFWATAGFYGFLSVAVMAWIRYMPGGSQDGRNGP